MDGLSERPSRNRRRVREIPHVSVWDRLQAGLDTDERIIFPWMYKENRDLYDKILGVAYLVRERHPDAQMDWVWESSLDKVIARYAEHGRQLDILAKQFVVRVRLPWNRVNYEFLVTQEELNENRADYRVLEVFLRARNKFTGSVDLIKPFEYEQFRDEWEMVEARYLVEWYTSPESDRKLCEIDPRYVHLALGE